MPPQFQSQFSPINPPEDDHQGEVLPKFSRSYAFLMTLVILLVITGVFGVWYFSNPLPDEETETVVITNKFADWKTYINEKYGFEFKYPPQYEAYEDTPEMVKIITSENRDIKGEPVNNMQIQVINNVEKLGVIDWWNKYGPYTSQRSKFGGIKPDSFPIKNKIVSGINGVYIGGSEGVLTNYLILPNNNKILEILVMIPDIDQILSTFKFISTSTPQVIESSKDSQKICAQVITPAKNTKTGEMRDFPTPCDVPTGWEVIK